MRKAGVERLRGVRQGGPASTSTTSRSRSRCSPTSSPRCGARRTRSRPGARTCTSRCRSRTRARESADAARRKSCPARGRAAERHGAVHARAGARRRPGAARRRAGGGLGLRRPHRRHGPRPVPFMKAALRHLPAPPAPSAELLWASPRELLNIVQAAEIGCDIITVTAGHAEEDGALRQGPRRLQPRDRADVPHATPQAAGYKL